MSLTIRNGGIVDIVDGPVYHRDLSRDVVGIVQGVASDPHAEWVGHPCPDILEVVLKRDWNGIRTIAHCLTDGESAT